MLQLFLLIQLMMLLMSTTILITDWLWVLSQKTLRKREYAVTAVITGCAIGMVVLSLLSLILHLVVSKSLETDTLLLLERTGR